MTRYHLIVYVPLTRANKELAMHVLPMADL